MDSPTGAERTDTMYNIILNGDTTYQPIGEAELVNVGAPAVAVWRVLAYITTDTPDDMGYLNLYALYYPSEDADSVDWGNPDSVEPYGYGYNPNTGRIC